MTTPAHLISQYILQVGDPDALDLEPLPLPKGEWGVTIEGDDVDYAGKLLYLSDDKRVAVGIERLGPSRLYGTHIGETLYFLRGRVQASPPEDEPYTLQEGDFCYFPPGLDDVWEIQETYVKLFVIHADAPLPF
jgi:uncharacterized cupin superfamily protein